MKIGKNLRKKLMSKINVSLIYQRSNIKNFLSNSLVYLILFFVAIISIYPVLWMLFGSLKGTNEFYTNIWGFPATPAALGGPGSPPTSTRGPRRFRFGGRSLFPGSCWLAGRRRHAGPRIGPGRFPGPLLTTAGRRFGLFACHDLRASSSACLSP